MAALTTGATPAGNGRAVPPAGCELDAAWVRDPRVSLRSEPFGALLYHFGTRRLSFLKDVRLRTVFATIETFPSARAACLAAGVAESELPAFGAALARLAAGDMLHPATEVDR